MSDVVYIGPGGRERRRRPLLRTSLGEVLRRCRLAQGRTLADVAGEARISMPYLSEVERGRKEASSEVLAAVCDALKVQLAEVLAEVGRDLSRDLAGAGARDQARIVGIEATRRRQAIAPPARRSGDVVLLAA